jgi:hypothetical protein
MTWLFFVRLVSIMYDWLFFFFVLSVCYIRITITLIMPELYYHIRITRSQSRGSQKPTTPFYILITIPTIMVVYQLSHQNQKIIWQKPTTPFYILITIPTIIIVWLLYHLFWILFWNFSQIISLCTATYIGMGSNRITIIISE